MKPPKPDLLAIEMLLSEELVLRYSESGEKFTTGRQAYTIMALQCTQIPFV